MDNCNLTGFRMCIELCLHENMDQKYFIFINKQWMKIKNVQDHIKNIFKIDEDINLFIGEVLLPENETIKLLQLNDVLIVKPSVSKKFHSKYLKWNTVENEVCPDLNVQMSVKRKKTTGLILNHSDTISNCLQELRDKREQITKTRNIDVASVTNNNDEVESLFKLPPIKKRKRKHKNKTNPEETSIGEETALNKSDLITFDSSYSSGKHIHFSDEENNDVIAHSSPKRSDSAEECRSTLSQLVKKPLTEKIFSRKTETSINSVAVNSGENVESVAPNINSKDIQAIVTSSLSDVPKVGDIIAFKKIKLGNDYTPQKSKDIVAEVLNVEGIPGSHVIHLAVIDGEEEFHDPEGKFSIDEKENGSKAGETLVVELKWNEILEPRLEKRH